MDKIKLIVTKIQNGLNKIKKIYKSNRNNSILLFIIIFITGYGMFFTSKGWLDLNNQPKKYTELNSTVNIDKRELKLVKWTYCEATQTMEIEVDVNNTNYDGINDFYFTANDRKGNMYKVNTIIVSPTLAVVQIENMKKLNEVRLTMQVNYGDRKSTDMAKFYTNIDQVEKVDKIITYSTMDEYYIARLDRYITDYNKQIQDLQNKIADENKKLDSYNAILTDLNKQKNYVAADELTKVNKQIADTNTGISECNLNIATYNNSIKDTKNKIQNTEAIKEVYK